MNTKKITKEDINGITVSDLPSRPTSDYVYGGEGYSSSQLKEAFDRLPLYIIESFNSLLDDISREGEESFAGAIPTGLEEGHTLYDLFEEIRNGSFASRILVGGEPLPLVLSRIEERLGL